MGVHGLLDGELFTGFAVISKPGPQSFSFNLKGSGSRPLPLPKHLTI
jgi:hypothetical protein